MSSNDDLTSDEFEYIWVSSWFDRRLGRRRYASEFGKKGIRIRVRKKHRK